MPNKVITGGQADSMFSSLNRLCTRFSRHYRGAEITLMFNNNTLHILADGKLKESHRINSVKQIEK